MNTSLLDSITDTHLDRSQILQEFHHYFTQMNHPTGFTVNFHPQIRRKINGRWAGTDLAISSVESFWDAFSGELRHMNYYSYERKMSRHRIMAFGNMDYGSLTNLFHIHGIVDNFFGWEDRIFRYTISSAIRAANNLCRIVSGDCHIDLAVDIGWVGYVFKDNPYCYPLIAK